MTSYVDLAIAIGAMSVLLVITWLQQKSEMAAIDEEAAIQRKFIESLSKPKEK